MFCLLRLRYSKSNTHIQMTTAPLNQQQLEAELAEFRINPFDFDEVRNKAAKNVLEDYTERVEIRTRKTPKKVIDPLEIKRNQNANILRDALRDRRADQKIQEKRMKKEWQQNIDKNVQAKMIDGGGLINNGGFDRRLLSPIRPFQGWMRGEDPNNMPHELTPNGWASPTRTLPPVPRTNQMRRSSQPVVGSGPIAWGRRTLHKNGIDVFRQTKNQNNDDDADETMSIHTVEDEEEHGPIVYAPDDMFSTPAELQHQWIPNYTEMPTTPIRKQNNQNNNEEKGSPNRTPRTPRSPRSTKMSPEEDARQQLLEQKYQGETKSGFRSPRTRNKRARGGEAMESYSDGHGSATLSMEAQNGNGKYLKRTLFHKM